VHQRGFALSQTVTERNREDAQTHRHSQAWKGTYLTKYLAEKTLDYNKDSPS